MRLLKSDRRVILLLMLIAIVSMCVMIFQDAMSEEKANEKEKAKDEAVGSSDKLVTNPENKRAELRSFDPNSVDSLTLLEYGLGAVQIHSLMAYRRHNGTFDKPLAVSKLYNWSDQDVDKVLPYIKIDEKYKKTYRYREQYEQEDREEYERARKPYKTKVYDQSGDAKREKEEAEQKYQESNKFKTLTKVDVNTADTTLLKRVPGIGKGIANAIIRLREKLGGFYSIEQLEEISFLSPELYEWLTVEPNAEIHLININKASFQELNSHHYISYNQARDLINYRRLYGEIKDKEVLIDSNIFTKEEVERLAPYLEY